MLTERTVSCPQCKGPSLYGAANAFRPFCSERCKDVDFGAWANQEFALASALKAEDLFELTEPRG